MDKFIESTDGIKIHYTETGNGNKAIVFVHGWLGNGSWWKEQEAYLKDQYKLVCIDLGGHGKSEKTRQNWTSKQYADDIRAVVEQLNTSGVILVGHSMSGAYVVEAAATLPQVKALVLVDTLKDLDAKFTPEQAEEYMYSHYRSDFKSAVENMLPQYLFAEKTPADVQRRLQDEFLMNSPDAAINALKPLYEMDLQSMAKVLDIPVRAINSDAQPLTSLENNRKYFKDYNYHTITETGHYPMLERPDKFNELLNETLKEINA
jgi:pimeloyl-ACP methyl ester carboxylesterase